MTPTICKSIIKFCFVRNCKLELVNDFAFQNLLSCSSQTSKFAEMFCRPIGSFGIFFFVEVETKYLIVCNRNINGDIITLK